MLHARLNANRNSKSNEYEGAENDIQNKLYLNKEFSEVVNDIYTIAVSGVIIYENKSFIFKQTPRSLPKYDKEITEQTKMYILNHLLTGGQYYILKMFEESLPIVASLLTQNR